MISPAMEKLKIIFPKSLQIIGEENWKFLPDSCAEDFPQILKNINLKAAPYLCDLARMELSFWRAKSKDKSVFSNISFLRVNPTLELLELSWEIISEEGLNDIPLNEFPLPSKTFVLIWKTPSEEIIIKKAASDDLLALKIIIEHVDLRIAAEIYQIPVGAIEKILRASAHKYILLSPSPLIYRNQDILPKDAPIKYLSASIFSIQWHITNECELNCRHCYDRSRRAPLKFDKAMEILDDLDKFCKERVVGGHISFTGGNPFLYPKFTLLYQAAAERGFSLSILGNPTDMKTTEKIAEIYPPDFIQLSIEGLETYNDRIRGRGHFKRVVEYLNTLKELGISSSVMLTLNKDNMNQILPLSKQLRNITRSFTFNRLSKTGSGRLLELPKRQDYIDFIREYDIAATEEPVLFYKDNMFNIIRLERNKNLTGGCTGHGCGAAFNFVAILPDGEVHACRKFPSYLGNIFDRKLADIYDSDEAAKYRSGCRECDGCAIRHVCGGCLAVSYSFGLDIFNQKDPYCFMPS